MNRNSHAHAHSRGRPRTSYAGRVLNVTCDYIKHRQNSHTRTQSHPKRPRNETNCLFIDYFIDCLCTRARVPRKRHTHTHANTRGRSGGRRTIEGNVCCARGVVLAAAVRRRHRRCGVVCAANPHRFGAGAILYWAAVCARARAPIPFLIGIGTLRGGLMSSAVGGECRVSRFN